MQPEWPKRLWMYPGGDVTPYEDSDTTPLLAFKAEDTPQPVAWIHTVKQNEGDEEDQALSFAPENFPLMGEAPGLFQSIGCAPLYAAPLDEAAIRKSEREAVEKAWRDAYQRMMDMHDGLLVVMQAAVIEMRHGDGAESAMDWIGNTLDGPGLIVADDDPHGKDAQAYYDANYPKIKPSVAKGTA